MQIPKNTKNIILSGLMLLGATGSIKKYSDSTKNQQYDAIKPLSTYDDLEHKTLDITPIVSEQIHNTLIQTPTDAQQHKLKSQALATHRRHALPTPNYKTDPQLLNTLTQIRDQYLMYAGDFAPTQLEEFDINTSQIGDALCASAIWSQLRIMNMRSPQMWQLFGQQEKHTRVAEQLLSSHGRTPRTQHTDQARYFNKNNTNYQDYVLDRSSHYHDVANTLASSQAGDFLTALYQGSGFKTTANESGKNATHSLLSLGTITKTLSGAALGFRTDESETQRLLHANSQEQQVIVLHRLLSLGVIRDNMLMEPETQKRYIRQILREFPQLITITISKPKQTPTDASTRTIDYTGVQVEHVYPLGKQEALDKLRTRYANSEGIFELEKQSNVIQRLYTNIEHKNTTKVPYNFRHFTIELLLTNQFLFCDIMKPTQSAISNYETLSPTYTQIEDTRKHLLDSIDIGHTHIVSFDDVDINRDKKINNKIIQGKKDKTINDILNDLANREYINIYADTNKNETEIKEIKSNFKKYIQQYFEILGVSSTGPILPIPLLLDENIKKIQDIHTTYRQKYSTRQQESQARYTKHIIEEINKKNININNIEKTGHIVYPLCQGDDEITITQQIAQYIDALTHQTTTNQIKIDNLSNEEYAVIYGYINTAIQYKKYHKNTNKPIIQQGDLIHIDLGKAIDNIQTYYTLKQKLSIDLLPPIHDEILGQFDPLFQHLEISPATASILKHQLIRENANGISFWDIAKKRSRKKYMAETLDFDDRNPLKSLQSVSSEGIWQIRINPYTETGDNMRELSKTITLLIKKQDILDFDESDKESLGTLLQLTQSAAQHYQNTKYEKNPDQKEQYNTKYIETRDEIRHILHDLINISNEDRLHPTTSISTAIQAKLLANSSEKNLWNYANNIKKAIGTMELNTQEIAFVQEFTIIANHLGKTDADQVFKTIMANFLIQRGQAIHATTDQEVDLFCATLKQLHDIREVCEKDETKKRAIELHKALETQFHNTQNQYIKDILQYLNPNNKIQTIPYYNTLRTQTQDDNNQPLEDGIFINTLFLESDSMSEFLNYLTTIPPDQDNESALFRLAIALGSLGTLGTSFYKSARDYKRL